MQIQTCQIKKNVGSWGRGGGYTSNFIVITVPVLATLLHTAPFNVLSVIQ